MDDRVQQVLDEELPRKALSQDELEQYDGAHGLIQAVLRGVPVEPLPDLSAAVLARLEAPAWAKLSRPAGVVRWGRSLFSWIWRPRSFALQLRPAYAFAAIALITTVLLTRENAPQAVPVAQAPQVRVFMQFRLDAPNAQAVSLAGDFTNWQPSYRLTRSHPGTWTIVVPLEPGVHDYAFIVDGERWTPDPMAPAIADGFGGLNSRLAVLPPDRSM